LLVSPQGHLGELPVGVYQSIARPVDPNLDDPAHLTKIRFQFVHALADHHRQRAFVRGHFRPVAALDVHRISR
jgi:hypothetical protein